MALACPECNGSTSWDDSVGSAVCTSCGTLTDPSQSVLTSQYDFFEQSSSWDPDLAVMARYSQAASSWALADQTKEARDKRNSLSILEFIKSLARSLNAPGLSPRAMALFHQAKAVTQFRWGRKAKLVAGACLSIALRESNRPDCLQDVAHLLGEPLPPLSRAYVSIIQTLGLVLSHLESTSYIPTLQHHLSSLMQDQPTALPSMLAKTLNSALLNSASNTANSLSRLLSRIGPPSVTKYPTPPIACAVYILSLESEIRIPIKPLGLLAQIVGARLHVGKGVVMACYKAIQDVLTSLAEKISWLDKYEIKEGRARVAKRSIVARSTRDIVAFYDDTWKGVEKPTLDITIEEGPESQSQDTHDGSSVQSPLKRRKTRHYEPMQFLLDPIAGPLPKPFTGLCHTRPPLEEPAPSQNSYGTQVQHPLLHYFLSSQATSLQPTRLQLLAATRGGADEISDIELFEEGELEGMMRSEDEMRVIQHLYDWSHEDEDIVLGEPSQPRSGVSSRNQVVQPNLPQSKEKHSRINLEAWAKLLDDGNDSSPDDEQYLTDLSGAEFGSSLAEWEGSEVDNGTAEESHKPSNEVIVGGWRPISPGNGTATDWYGEAYGQI